NCNELFHGISPLAFSYFSRAQRTRGRYAYNHFILQKNSSFCQLLPGFRDRRSGRAAARIPFIFMPFFSPLAGWPKKMANYTISLAPHGIIEMHSPALPAAERSVCIHVTSTKPRTAARHRAGGKADAEDGGSGRDGPIHQRPIQCGGPHL